MDRSEDKIKQVIVMRADLGMRKGKMIAQGAHASLSFMSFAYRKGVQDNKDIMDFPQVSLKAVEKEWLLSNGFTKICVKAESQEQLREVYQRAKDARLTVHLITDSGLTEFNGVPTETCLAIGPDYSSKIDVITGDLKLF